MALTETVSAIFTFTFIRIFNTKKYNSKNNIQYYIVNGRAIYYCNHYTN